MIVVVGPMAEVNQKMMAMEVRGPEMCVCHYGTRA